MDNPYQPPLHPPKLSQPVFHVWRIVAWSILIYAVANMVGIASGLSMRFWDVYGDTVNEAIVSARLIRRIGYGVVGAILYWRFAVGVTSRRLLHVLVLFALVQVIDVAVSWFAFFVPIDELLDPWSLGRSLLAAAVGLGIAVLRSGKSEKSSSTT